MMNNSIAPLQQIISILLGLFSTYIIFDFMNRFNRNLYYKKYRYIMAYCLFTLVIIVSSIYCIPLLSFAITIATTAD